MWKQATGQYGTSLKWLKADDRRRGHVILPTFEREGGAQYTSNTKVGGARAIPSFWEGRRLNYPQIDRLVSNISEGIKSEAMEGGARPPTFLEGGGGWRGTGVFQVCPSGSQEIKLHYSLKRHQTLILGIHIKSASLQKKKQIQKL